MILRKDSFFKMLIILVYFIPLHIRDDIFGIFLPNDLAYTAAILLPIFVIFLIIIYNKVYKFVYVLFLFALLILSLTYIFSIKDFSLIKVLSKYSPLLLTGVLIRNKDSFERIFTFFLKCLNIIGIFMFFSWVVDYWITDSRPIVTIITSFVDNPYGSQSDRFYSFYTHPLNTKSILLQIATINLLYGMYMKKNETKYFVNFLFFGLFSFVSTQSKTGIIIFALLLLVYIALYKKSYKLMLVTFPVIGILYVMGVFDKLLLRFQTTTLTSGRGDLLNLALEKSYYNPKLFVGYGEDFSSIYATDILGWNYGFEYFAIIVAIDYGIIFTFLILLLMIICPLVLSIKYKFIPIFLMVVLIFIDLNSYNALVVKTSEMMIMYSIFVMICINIIFHRFKSYENG